MYDELIKRLRNATTLPTIGYLFGEAADAIEDLQNKLQDSENDNINLTGWLAEEHVKHLWIPVTERLPEKIGYYLAHIANINQMSMATDAVALWDGNHFYVSSFVVVTHWMPLPEPPESENK